MTVSYLFVVGKPIHGVSGITLDCSEDGIGRHGDCGSVFELHEGVFSSFVNGYPMKFVGTSADLLSAVMMVASKAYPGVTWVFADNRDYPSDTIILQRADLILI